PDLVFGHHLNTSSLSIAGSLSPTQEHHDTPSIYPHDLPASTPLLPPHPSPISTVQAMAKITMLDNIDTHSSYANAAHDSPASPASPLPSSSFTASSAFSSAVDSDVPILPSELRKRHEALKRQKHDEKQQQPQPKEQPLHPSKKIDHHTFVATQDMDPPSESFASKYSAESPIESSRLLEQDRHDSQNEMDHGDRHDMPFSGSYHASGVIRAKSYSMFESSSGSMWSHPEQDIARRAYGGNIARNSMGLPEMPTRDWVKMQTRISTLEQEVSHASRTNLLLNQELDKVSDHLQRLTSESGEGWRREYEFLVQQVDLMHRQLQVAYNEMRNGGQHTGNTSRRGSTIGQAEVTRELHAEVKELTASLRTWQAAFRNAEENYRRKCDGERELKQTLRERENQLSSLVEKLTGYESEFQKSISYYEELMRLSSELEALEGRGDSPMALALESGSSEQPYANTHNHMPGYFPERSSEHHTFANIDQLSVSILSWATLLATYILS
ncbi:hypothetical protein CPC16_011084, partial [Podila verticillata]